MARTSGGGVMEEIARLWAILMFAGLWGIWDYFPFSLSRFAP